MNFWLCLTRWWVVGCALLGAGGWVLSALHLLNRTGYSVLLGTGLIAAVWSWNRMERRARAPWSGWKRRGRRSVPLVFLGLSALVLLSALLYAPSNYDGMTYRIPRVLHWLAEGRWHWIDSVDARVNNRACGFEWATAPFLLFTHTERGIVVLNLVSFLLLPGLMFSVFTRLGVGARTAWWWMWLLPSGYCFLLQAGSGGNDLFGATLALAAVDFALRAARSGRGADVWLSMLAAAAMTSVKTTNLTLLLPWAVALLPAWRVVLSRPIVTLAVAAWAALASFLPMAVLNQRHCGDWTGASMEKSVPVPSLAGGIAGNAFLIVQQSLVPPVFPMASWWNTHVRDFLPGWLRGVLEKSFERNSWTLPEMAIEETTAPGFGVTVLLVAGWIGVARGRDRTRPADIWTWWRRAVRAASWVSLLAYMIRVAISTAGRVLAPFFSFLFVTALCPGGWAELVRRRWWRIMASAIMWLALVVLILNPARPLWPARTVLARLRESHPTSTRLERMVVIHDVYARRNDALAPLRAFLPSTAREVGCVSLGDDLETPLWRPFGSRRIHQVGLKKDAATLRAAGIEYVVISPFALADVLKMDAREWLTRYDAELVGEARLQVRGSRPPETWFVARLRPARPAP